MKKFLIVLTLLAISIPAHAGFVSSEQQSNTCKISEVLKMHDNAFVVVEGNVIKQVGDEKYLLKDDKNQIIVEIDDELWSNINVSPKTKIRVMGEVDKDFNSIKIDASKVEIIK